MKTDLGPFFAYMLKRLSENPYLHYGSMSSTVYDITGDYSVNALKRDFKYLFSLTEEDYTIHFLMNKYNTLLIGVLDNWENSVDRVMPIFKLRFSEKPFIYSIPSEINNKKILQTDRVVLKKDLRNYSISYQVYINLTRLGYVVISDTTHYEPARGLWLKLAKNNNKVLLCDVDYGLLKDNDGITLIFDGYNYPLEQIWTSGSDYSVQYLVLILTKG